MKKNNIAFLAVALILGTALGFFGGMKYQQGRFGSLQGQLKIGQFPQGFEGRTGMRIGENQPGVTGNKTKTGFRPVSGEVISLDDKSLTVKMQDGSSTIVLISGKTEVNEAQTVDFEKIKTGDTVSVFGTANTDGSLSAQSIQLNPKAKMQNAQ